jgi:hypothetical protein
MTRKLIGLIGVAGVLFGFGAVPALADDTGYNPPPAVTGKCDAGHGAFGAFSHNFAFFPGNDEFPAGTNWIAADAKEDGGLGHDTGPTNSGFSQFCKTQ